MLFDRSTVRMIHADLTLDSLHFLPRYTFNFLTTLSTTPYLSFILFWHISLSINIIHTRITLCLFAHNPIHYQLSSRFKYYIFTTSTYTITFFTLLLHSHTIYIPTFHYTYQYSFYISSQIENLHHRNSYQLTPYSIRCQGVTFIAYKTNRIW